MGVLDGVRALTAEIDERASETEAGRSVPTDLARRIGAAGAFHLFVPESLDGPQVDPVTALHVVEELSRADGSTGWTSMILNTTFFSSWLEPDVARKMLSTDRQRGMAGLFGPIGKGTANGDGTIRLTGRWPFNSGSPHAAWFCQGAMVADGDTEPQWRFLFVPEAEAEIHDTWHVAGLRGTASHDVSVDAAVPVERTANPLFETAPHDAPHFRWSFFGLLAALMVGFPLGVARRSLDEFKTLATRAGRGGGEPLATEQVCQLEVARCEGSLRAARASVLDAVGDAWDTSVSGDPISQDQRLAIRLATANAMRVGLDVVDTTFRLAGGKALYDTSPLQRCWRDLHAGSQHIFFSNNHVALAGQAVLGQLPEPWFM